MQDIKIFSGSGSVEFTKKVCAFLGVAQGQCEVMKFSDGNIFVRILETVRGKDVFLIQSIALFPNDEFTETLFWLDAFKRASAASVTLIMPYFGYAKGDKKDEPRVSIRARVCAESIELAGADRVVAMDLHSAQIQGFFKKPVDHVYALPVFTKHLRSLNIDNPVLVSPDTGFIKQTRLYSEVLGWPMAVGDKIRRGHDEKAKVVEIIGKIEGHDAVIVDDFAISGGTLIDLAHELKARGAKKVRAVLSHILLREGGVEKLMNSPIDELYSTDSVENSFIENCSKITIVTAAPLLANAIQRIARRESLVPLFEEN